MPWTSTVRRARPHGSSCVTSTAMRARGGCAPSWRTSSSTTSPTSRAPRKTTAPRVAQTPPPASSQRRYERSAMGRNAYSQSSPPAPSSTPTPPRAAGNSVSGAHTEDHTLAAPERGVLRFLPHQHIDAHAHGGTFWHLRHPSERARHPGRSLELCHEYLCNCLRRGRHPDVLRQRRRRTVRAIPAGTSARPAPSPRGFEPDRIEHERGNARAPPARRIRSDRSGLGMHQDFPDDDDCLSGDDYFGRRAPTPKIRTGSTLQTARRSAKTRTTRPPPRSRSFATISARARTDVSTGTRYPTRPSALAPPPLADLELTPRVVEDLIARLDADAEPAYVTVTATGRSNGAAPPFYRARVYGRWPRGARGASSVCEIALGLDDWLEGEPAADANAARAPHRYRRLVRDRNSIEFVDHRLGRREKNRSDVLVSGTTTDSRRGGCSRVVVSLKRRSIYVARDVVDRFGVHPLGWRSSFHPSRADLERVDRDRRRRRSVDDASAGSAYRLHCASELGPRRSRPLRRVRSFLRGREKQTGVHDRRGVR